MKEPPRRRSNALALVGFLVAAWLGAVFVAAQIDESVMRWLDGPGPFSAPSIRAWIEPVFRETLDAAVFLTVLGVLFAFSNRRRLVASWLIGILLSAGFTRIMKIAIGRSRPRADAGADSFEPFSFGSVSHSFPSGHTSSAFAMAALLGLYFPRGRVIFWILALVVGLERVRTGAHFLSDVIGGAGVGLLAVYVSYRGLGSKFFELNRVDAPSLAQGDAVSRG